MTCSYCGQELVEVDNPFRREVRHKRGVTCTAVATDWKRDSNEVQDNG